MATTTSGVNNESKTVEQKAAGANLTALKQLLKQEAQKVAQLPAKDLGEVLSGLNTYIREAGGKGKGNGKARSELKIFADKVNTALHSAGSVHRISQGADGRLHAVGISIPNTQAAGKDKSLTSTIVTHLEAEPTAEASVSNSAQVASVLKQVEAIAKHQSPAEVAQFSHQFEAELSKAKHGASHPHPSSATKTVASTSSTSAATAKHEGAVAAHNAAVKEQAATSKRLTDNVVQNALDNVKSNIDQAKGKPTHKAAAKGGAKTTAAGAAGAAGAGAGAGGANGTAATTATSNASGTNADGGINWSGDINGLIMAVLLRAYKASTDQVRRLAKNLDAITQQKNALGLVLNADDAKASKDAGAPGANGQPSTAQQQDTTKKDADQRQYDSLGNDSQKWQLELQNEIQVMQQLLSAMTNYLKNRNDISQGILQNFK